MITVQKIKQAIANAEKRQSKLTPELIRLPFLGSLQIRHLLNNLGELATFYTECGSHKGGSFNSAVYENYNLKFGYAIDSFESDRTQGETAEFQFLQNTLKYMPHTMELRLLRQDHFEVDFSHFHGKADFYLFDGSHDYESQRKGITYYYPVLADECIVCVDDADWEPVQKGTYDGIKECGFEILFEQYLKGNDHDNEGWHNGFFVFLLKKKS